MNTVLIHRCAVVMYLITGGGMVAAVSAGATGALPWKWVTLSLINGLTAGWALATVNLLLVSVNEAVYQLRVIRSAAVSTDAAHRITVKALNDQIRDLADNQT